MNMECDCMLENHHLSQDSQPTFFYALEQLEMQHNMVGK